MKKLVIIFFAALLFQSSFAQTEAKISGRFLNYKNHTINLFIQGKHFSNYRHASQTVPVNKDGSFSFKTSGMGEPYQISITFPGMVMFPLFFADGYDLHLNADASDPRTFYRTLTIAGKGSGINSYWKKFYEYTQSHSDTINWYRKSEGVYLKHFTDSIHAVTDLIKTIGESDSDPHREFLKKTFMSDQKIRSAKSLYGYSYFHRYNAGQTRKLLEKAGLPDAHEYLQGYERFNLTHLYFIPASENKIDGKVVKSDLSMWKDHFMTRSIIGVRIEPTIREDAEANPGFGQPIIERNGKRIFGDAYIGDEFKQYDLHAGDGYVFSYVIDGKKYVELAGYGITEKNASEFQYRIIKNGLTEQAEWKKSSEFRTTADGEIRYAYFGKFEYKEEQTLHLEVRNIKETSIHDEILIDWRKIKKPVISLDMNYIRTWRPGYRIFPNGFTVSLQGSLSAHQAPQFLITASPDISFRMGDSLRSLALTLKSNPETYNYYITLKHTAGSKTKTLNLGKTNTSITLDKSLWSEPGKYEITFMPRLFNIGGSPYKDFADKAARISFTVLPALDSPAVFSMRQLLLILAGFILTAGLIFYVLRRNQQKKISHEKQQKELATLQLRSVRSQLNPHFMFNALAGIQNLMNRNEPDAANLYLSKFARLTRNVLDENEKDMITISAEAALLEDYLEMEKMRFGFGYRIEIDERINKDNTEIPAMLLQPFVENAVKHGVADLTKDGLITVCFIANGKDLVLQVQDNGSGMIINDSKGKGIKLSQNRIDLYNRLYGATAITMSIDQNENGTIISLKLKDWI